VELIQLSDNDLALVKCPQCKGNAVEKKIKIKENSVDVEFYCDSCEMAFTAEYLASRFIWKQGLDYYVMWKYWTN
jgi:transposase-like protein